MSLGGNKMPKDTFFNLEEGKRIKIIKAAKAEFLNKPLRKARVSNIVTKASIPRGSFYQYFEDLDDLYYYIVEEVFTEIFDAGFSYSEMTNDLFEFAKISFDFDYQGFKKESRHKYMSNVFRSISGNNEYLEMYNKKRTKYIEDILDRLDLSNIRFNTREEQIKMYQMIQELKISVINRTMMKNLSKEEAFSEFEWYLDILKTGLLKEE
jgi:AcrR family transcriptional regulator